MKTLCLCVAAAALSVSLLAGCNSGDAAPAGADERPAGQPGTLPAGASTGSGPSLAAPQAPPSGSK